MTYKQINATPTTSRAVYQIGFWSAILTTTWIIIFNIAIALGVAGASTRSVAVGASLLLVFSFIALMVSIHSYAPPEKKIWSQIGLSFAIVYAALLTWNYFLQLTVVRNNPQLYEWLIMDFTPDTAFWSLETVGYTLMGLAALFALPVFNGGGIERAIRWCFAINAVFTVVGSIGYVLSGNPLHGLVLASLGVWAIVFPIATTLLAVMFKRVERMNMR
ncbi:MAG: hypothetical protein QXQ64_08445 [Candidatus Bathyarchaeia archaeon]|uniref:hypothetical protein n=1 Tax=Candidatus Hadarchaeum sp. TaxID=2883567 RepID=UPI00317CB963